ncbi:MAG TPA: Ig-like domain-containing protein, partial [Anaerolineae bacterium]
SQPRLIDWQPGAIDAAPPNTVIELRFDQPMNVESVRAAFHITPTVPLTFTANVNEIPATTFASPFVSPLVTRTFPGTVIQFIPERPLDKATRYRIALDTTARNAGGQPLATSFTAVLTTAGQLKATFYPNDGQTNVSVNSAVDVSFDVPFATTTKLPLIFSPAANGAGQWLTDRRYAASKLALQPATRYTVRLPEGLQALGGEKLLDEAVTTFTTTLPRVETYSPQGVFVKPSSIVSLTFNLPVVTSSVESRFGVYQGDGRKVVGQMSWPFSHTLVFKPNQPLIDGAEYSVKVEAGIRSSLGDTPADREFVGTFRVAPMPEMTSSSPGDGDLRASIGDRVTLHFNVPMDTADVEGALHISPLVESPRFEWSGANTTLDIVFEIDPTVQYSLAFDDTARDEYGRRLQGNRSVVFQAAPQKPIAWLVGPRGYWNNVYGSYNPSPSVKQYAQYRNVNRLTYRLSSIAQADFLSMVQPDWYRNQKLPRSTFIMSWA